MFHDSSFMVRKHGQAAMTAVLILLFVSLAAVFGASALALREAKAARNNESSRFAYFAAEAGVEDGVYRLLRNKNLSPAYSVTLNGATADTIVTNISSAKKEIKTVGDFSNTIRAVRTEVITGTVGVNFFYGVQVGDGGLEMGNNSQVNGSVYSNGSITGSGLITGDAIVAGGILQNPSVEWTAQNSDNFFATISTNRDIAQSFMANTNGNLNRVSVYIAKVGNPTSNITLRITNDNGDKPATSNIASAVIPYTSVGLSAGWVDVSFASSPSLTNGNKYWIVLDYGSNSSVNYWNWRKDNTDAYAGNTGKYTSSWSSGSASWTNVGGDLAFRAWIGGTNTRIEGVTIGNSSSGTGRANLFVGATVHGSSCPNQYCIVENPAREELPISDGVIQDWRDEASSGGTCAPPLCDALGNLEIMNGSSKTIGPIRIPGTLKVSNNAALTINGTVFVEGVIDFSNNCIIKLAPGYGANSGVILSDDVINVSNNCTFQGSGQSGSYILLLSAKVDPTEEVIEVSNNSIGVIYYAQGGKIEFSNNAGAKEAVGYGIEMENNATITYESGLQNVNFASGPTGGWGIDYWQEIVP